jgi:hypothetical protein
MGGSALLKAKPKGLQDGRSENARDRIPSRLDTKGHG